MHTVTKVLVVFAAILCVLLAALTMAYSVNAERIVSDYKAQVLAKQTAEQSASSDISSARLEMDVQNNMIRELRNTQTNLNNQIQSLQAELATKRAEVNAAQLAGDASKSQIDNLTASVKTYSQLIDSYRGEVTKLRENELSFRQKEIELVDRLNDLESQREVQDGNIRALQEQLAELRRTIDSHGTGVPAQGIAAGPYKPSIPISGKIVAVGATKSGSGKPIVTMNVGTNNQVRENMELAIFRGGNFIANVVVTKTDLQWAVGEVNTLGKNVDIREGDSVGSLASR